MPEIIATKTWLRQYQIASWGLLHYRTSLQNTSSTHITQNLICPQVIAQLMNNFEILHRARQYHCRALCKILKWFVDWNWCYGHTWFHEIWVSDKFGMDNLCCSRPQQTQCALHDMIFKLLFFVDFENTFIYWLSRALANDRWCYICNIFSHWLRHHSATDGKHS